MNYTKPAERTYELDLIRFIAAILVVIYHYKSLIVTTMAVNEEFVSGLYAITKFGYLGVDLFFIISGFVIFSSARNSSCYQFSISRLVRIYPTYWICLILTVLILIITDDKEIPSLFKFFTNFSLFHTYLGVESIDGVYWTLVTEIKFYICIFVLLYFNWIEKYKLWLSIWLALTVLFFLTEHPTFFGWFISPYYSPYFISGIIFHLAKKDGYESFHVIILSISAVLSSIYVYDIIDEFSRNITVFDRIIAVIIVLSFYCLFVIISLNKFSIKFNKTILTMGGMTYPLYLLHNTIGQTIFNSYIKYFSPIILVVIISVLILLMSYLIHIYFEKRYSYKIKRFFLKSQ